MTSSYGDPDKLEIPLIIRRSPRARRISLKIDSHSGAAVLVLPRNASESEGVRFAEKHQHWLKSKLLELPPPIAFEDGALIPLRGQDLRIIHQPHGRGLVKERDGELVVFGQPEYLARRLKDWLKRQARTDIGPLVTEKAALIGQKHGRISVRDQKTRWGSCAVNGNLSFNWRLILAPSYVLEYVVAHEVAHLAEHNHSKAFWHKVGELTAFAN
ncbi:MAG: SprT family zinc-dependent metalloprotease, partial [Proteobacteria bacterium]|nr:SprT family zinc-dependent metalloprotease [Pseudomonadota bacterium]